MTTEQWLAWARADAQAREIEGLVPLVEALAGSQRALRGADWNVRAEADPIPAPPPAAGRRSLSTTPMAQSASPAASLEASSITELVPRLVSGEVSATAVVEACLDAIARRQDDLNAMIVTLADEARAAAADADRRRAAGAPLGPLHGIPITLKDLIDLRGVPTTAASRVRAGRVATADATVTRRLKDAGAIILGKTNLHEFAFGTTNEDSAFGAVRHPLDPTRSPGGSSGGSAAAVVAGMGLASIGTDTGGSIRIPAAACGLVGLKGAFGDVPTDGVVPLAWSLDHVGPLARTVADAWLLWNVLTGRPPATPRVSRIEGLRLVVLEPYFCDLLEDGVRRAFFSAVDRLRDAGAAISPRALPHASWTAPVYLHLVMAEAFAYHGPTLEERPGDYTVGVRTRLEMGRYVLGQDYVRAQLGREVLTREVDAILETCDAVLLPTLPMAAPRLGAATVRLGAHDEPVRAATLRNTQLFDVTGHPAITVPIGEADGPLRAGLQIVGRKGGVDDLLAIAMTEVLNGHSERRF